MAEYKLRAAESLREIDMIRRMGVEFRFGAGIETAEDLQELEAEFDFIFLGLGLGAMQQLNIPGEETQGVMNALELIAGYKTGRIRELAGTVVVVGAGNTAIDAANAARRLGAETVYLLYRRGESDIPAFDFEYEHSKVGRRAVPLASPARCDPRPTRMGSCFSTQCRRTRWIASCCPFPIRTSRLRATWWCRRSASRQLRT